MAKHFTTAIVLLGLMLASAGCSYNPFTLNNRTTGDPMGAVVGASVGAGGMALLTSSKPMIVLAGIGGGMLGYYVTTLRYDAGGVIQGGGQVYQVGDYIGIIIPTDSLFEENTAEFLPQSKHILDSAAAVLKHRPSNNIIISGNTSGFARTRWERKLSEKRAQKVSAYLWDAGVDIFRDRSNETRKLNYVGYGNYFPIANDYTNAGIRANSRIQITSYPTACDLMIDKHHQVYNNIGSPNERAIKEAPACSGGASMETGGCGSGCNDSMA